MAVSGISYLTLKYFIPIILLIPAPISAINAWQNRKKTSTIPTRIPYKPQSLSNKLSGRMHYNLNLKNDNLGADSLLDDIAAIEINHANNAQGHAIESEKRKIDLSIETLKKIEWYSFELFCKIYYEIIGFRVVKTKAGADGGIDLLLYQANAEALYAIVQCKVRAHRDIGINYIRELLGVMTSEKVDKSIFVTSSGFTKEAFEFANAHQIEPVDVSMLWMKLSRLDPDKRQLLIDFLESSDFTTPTCPNCEIKLVERIAKKGKSIGHTFWGCRNYPRCHYKLHMN